LQDGDSVSVMTVQEKCDEKSLGAASGHRKVTCRQFGTAPLRLSLRAGFLEKREKGRTPSYFVSVLKTNPRYTFRVEVAHPPGSKGGTPPQGLSGSPVTPASTLAPFGGPVL
jgi:hypothetical protein